MGTGYFVTTAGVRSLTGSLGAVADQCSRVGGQVGADGLPANAFGRTTHGPLLSGLCATFQTAIAERMRSTAQLAEQMAGAVRQAAAEYENADAVTASSYRLDAVAGEMR